MDGKRKEERGGREGGRRGEREGGEERGRKVEKQHGGLGERKPKETGQWILPMGSEFQAMVSVMAVNIQFSSPRGVRRSFSLPGTLGGEGREMKTEEMYRREVHCV